MVDDVLMQKLASIDRCVRQVREFVGGDLDRLKQQLVQDAVVLNLQRAGVLTPPTAARMRAMVGFRNVAVHQYQLLDQGILRAVVERHLGDFADLCRELSGE